jgi:predicted secreted protein
MSLIWVIVWFIYRSVHGAPPQLHILNIWLLTLIIAALIDLFHYRTYIVR